MTLINRGFFLEVMAPPMLSISSQGAEEAVIEINHFYDPSSGILSIICINEAFH